MDAYNRYPDQFKKVSIVQYDADVVEYDDKTDQIITRRQKDLFNRFANKMKSNDRMTYNSVIEEKRNFLAS